MAEYNVGNMLQPGVGVKYYVNIVDTLNDISSTGHSFQYRPNPVITNVTSLSTIVR